MFFYLVNIDWFMNKNRIINFIKFYLFMKGNVKNLLFMFIFKLKIFFVLYKNN